MSKPDLYKVHEDLSTYFELVLSTHLELMKSVKEQLANGDIKVNAYVTLMRDISLPPATLTAISSFLKTNDIMVVTDDLKAEVDNHMKVIDEFAKSASIKSLDHKADLDS